MQPTVLFPPKHMVKFGNLGTCSCKTFNFNDNNLLKIISLSPLQSQASTGDGFFQQTRLLR